MFRPNWWRKWLAQEQYLERTLFEAVVSEVAASPYLAPTTLNSGFVGTLGFSVTFKRGAGQRTLAKYLPQTANYLERMLDPLCNAFFLNPLVILESRHVGEHVDCSLRTWTYPEEPPCPLKVSVLYLEVPPLQKDAGSLLLYFWGRTKAISPKANMLVEFDGRLPHEVSTVSGEQPQQQTRRVSLVCEQYVLEPELLSRVPEHHLNSHCQFDSFLAQAVDLSQIESDLTEFPESACENLKIGNIPRTRPASSDAT